MTDGACEGDGFEAPRRLSAAVMELVFESHIGDAAVERDYSTEVGKT